jgi:hypothetical protein
MPIERLVRPYQTPELTPPQVEFAPGATESNAPVRLRIGLVGKSKIFQGSNSLTSTVYVIRKPKETQKTAT